MCEAVREKRREIVMLRENWVIRVSPSNAMIIIF